VSKGVKRDTKLSLTEEKWCGPFMAGARAFENLGRKGTAGPLDRCKEGIVIGVEGRIVIYKKKKSYTPAVREGMGEAERGGEGGRFPL